MRIRVLVLSLLLAAGSCLAASFSGKVVRVSDGDTLTVDWDGLKASVRLAYVDAPEKKQIFGPEAKQMTTNLALGQTVTVQIVNLDRYGRFVGVVILSGNKELNFLLVSAGLAWVYTDYPYPKEYEAEQQRARKKRFGLWINSSPQPPWEWRHLKQ